MSAVPAASDVFRAVSDPTRRAMLDLLRNGDRSAGDLAEPFDMTRPAVSQHLRVLQDAGLVRGRQRGRQRVYRLTARPLRDVCRWADNYVEVADPAGHAWRVRHAGAAVFHSLSAQPADAQDRPAPAPAAPAMAPGPEHRRLGQPTGAWTFDVEFRVSPKAPWQRSSGRGEYRTILGDRFTIEMRRVGPGGEEFTTMRMTATRKPSAQPEEC